MSRIRGGLLTAALFLALTPGPLAGGKPRVPPTQTTRTDRYGDPLPEGASARLGTVRLRHGSLVATAIFSADGKIITSFGHDHVFRVWDVKTGKQLRQCSRRGYQPEWIDSAAFSPDGKLLAVGCGSRKSPQGLPVLLCDPNTGKEVRRLTAPWAGWAVVSLAFAADGQILAAGDQEGQIHLWRVASGKRLRSIRWQKKVMVSGLAFSPNGRLLASVNGDDCLSLWNVTTGKEVRRLQTDSPGNPGKSGITAGLAFTPDGKTLAAGSSDAAVRLWSVASGKELRRFREDRKGKPDYDNRFHTLAFLPDGKNLITDNENGTIELWDTATGKRRYHLSGHRKLNYCHGSSTLALSPDGKTLASWGWENALRLWRTATGKELIPLECQRRTVLSVAISPDGKAVASGGEDASVRLWEANTAKEIRRLSGHPNDVNAVAFSPGGDLLASGGRYDLVRLWSIKTGKELRQLGGHSVGVNSMVFAPNGKALASASWHDYNVQVWELKGGRKPRLLPIEHAWRICFSPDGQVLAAGGRDGTLGLWAVDSGKELRQFKGHKESIDCLAYSPDGKALASCDGLGILRLWEVASGGQRWRFPGKATSLAFSPTGGLLASGGPDGVVHLWDTVTGMAVGKLPGHRGPVLALAFSSDGTRLVSGSADTTLLVWDIPGRLRLRPPRPNTSPTAVPAAVWEELAASDAGKAFQALARLAAAPEKAVALLKDRLSLTPAVTRRVEGLIRDLSSEQFRVRQRAAAVLKALLPAAEPALRRALAGNLDLEARQRIERLLKGLRGVRPSGGCLQILRATEFLERLGTPEARKVLKALAKGPPEARLTREAKASLKRLAKHPAANTKRSQVAR
jgi:WD40 repeat protein